MDIGSILEQVKDGAVLVDNALSVVIIIVAVGLGWYARIQRLRAKTLKTLQDNTLGEIEKAEIMAQTAWDIKREIERKEQGMDSRQHKEFTDSLAKARKAWSDLKEGMKDNKKGKFTRKYERVKTKGQGRPGK